MALLTDAFDEFKDIDQTTMFDVTFTRPPLTWIDPKKEMDGIEKELSTGIESKESIIRRRNGDPARVLAERLAEHKKEIEAGLLVISDPEESGDNENKDEE